MVTDRAVSRQVVDDDIAGEVGAGATAFAATETSGSRYAAGWAGHDEASFHSTFRRGYGHQLVAIGSAAHHGVDELVLL